MRRSLPAPEGLGNFFFRSQSPALFLLPEFPEQAHDALEPRVTDRALYRAKAAGRDRVEFAEILA